MVNRRVSFFPVIACCAILIFCCCAFMPVKASVQEGLSIPSVRKVAETGYPTNVSGETYGPDLKESSLTPPALVLVKNEDGLFGYIRESEISGASVTTPEEAARYAPHDHYINMYLEDGKTIIGQFFVSAGIH